MESWFRLDIVIGKITAIFKLSVDEGKSPSSIRRSSFFVLNFGLNIVDCVKSFNVESHSLASESFDEDLDITSAYESEYKMESWFLLDIVVGKSSSIFNCLASEDHILLIRGNSFLVLDLSFNVVDGVRSLNVESDGLACKCFNENLHVS